MKSPIVLFAFSALLMLPALADKTETPLGEQMGEIKDALKGFRKETDPAKCAVLAKSAQQSTAKCLLETPEMLAKMPDGPEKTKAALEYRKMVGKLYVSFCEIEEAYLAGNSAEATKILTALSDVKKSGHDKFIEKKKS